MKCQDFKEKIVGMFDKEIPMKEYEALKGHMDECPTCREEYEAMKRITDCLQPKYSPVATEKRSASGLQRLGKIAASVAIIIVAISIGWTLFSSQPVKAEPFTLSQGIANLSGVNSFTIQMRMRTNNHENFAHFDPQADFVNIHMTQLVQGDSTFWRVEKETGRTVVYNGREQYLWVPNVLYAIGSANSNFIEQFTELLDPKSLLKIQQKAIEAHKDVTCKTRITDTEAVITTETDVEYLPIALLKERPAQLHKLFIENVFSLPDGLLRSFKIWMIYEDREVELAKSIHIKYDQPLHKEILVRIPQGVEWMDLRTENPPITSAERLQRLQTEDATQAAKRIMEAITSGKTKDASEALFTYRQVLPKVVEAFHLCKASDFSAPKTMERYAGVFVFYTLTLPDGTTRQKHLALRKDNEQSIWMLDGGI